MIFVSAEELLFILALWLSKTKRSDLSRFLRPGINVNHMKCCQVLDTCNVMKPYHHENIGAFLKEKFFRISGPHINLRTFKKGFYDMNLKKNAEDSEDSISSYLSKRNESFAMRDNVFIQACGDKVLERVIISEL